MTIIYRLNMKGRTNNGLNFMHIFTSNMFIAIKYWKTVTTN